LKTKYLYLIDTCAWVHYYKGNEKVKALLNHIIEQKGLKRATLFMPSFCIAEVFNTFARWRYRGNDIKISEDEYTAIKTAFRNHVRRGVIISEYPLHIYHIYNTDHIIPFEHQWEIDKGEALSTFDILIIAMGVELVRHFGDSCVRVLTAEKRLTNICNKLRGTVTNDMKKKWDIPDDIHYPIAHYLPNTEKKDLPVVSGQKL